MARFFRAGGFCIGGKWLDEIDAGLEDRDFTWINKRIASVLEFRDYYSTRKMRRRLWVEKAVKNYRKKVVKDPRIVGYPGVVEYWCERRQDLKFLLLVRDLDEVYHSRVRAMGLREGMKWELGPSYEGKELTIKKFKRVATRRQYDFIETVTRFGMPLQVLNFPTIIGRYELVHEALQSLGYRVGHGFDIWHGMARTDKIHVGKTRGEQDSGKCETVSEMQARSNVQGTSTWSGPQYSESTICWEEPR
jgi:hypothetical protein